MRNVSDKCCRENQNTRSTFNNFFLENNVVKYCRGGQTTDENVIGRTRIACLIPKPTNTRSQYIILIAFPLQQWLHESASVLHYTYTVSLVRNFT